MVIVQQIKLRKFSSRELLGQDLNEAVLPWEVSFVSSYRQYLFDSVQMVVHEYWSNSKVNIVCGYLITLLHSEGYLNPTIPHTWPAGVSCVNGAKKTSTSDTMTHSSLTC
jgi:hypothetical protein